MTIGPVTTGPGPALRSDQAAGSADGPGGATTAPEPGGPGTSESRAGGAGAGETGGGPRASSLPGSLVPWRRWRLPLVLVALILLSAVAIAILQPAPKTNDYLDPAGTGSAGTHALTDILAARGHQVISTYSPSAALAAAGSSGATMIITSPDLLTVAQLTLLSRTAADIVLVDPDQAALTVLSPGITIADRPVTTKPLLPGCHLTAALLAGNAQVGGLTFVTSQAPAGAVGCYPAGGHPSLVRYSGTGKVVTVLGSGTPLSNGFLARDGNAALALNLLTTSHRIVWLTPEPPQAVTASSGRGSSAPPLIPLAAYLVVLQLAIAVLLAAVWRARRLGPLVPEQLPVVVRASETVEGHARLYQSRRARDRAAAVMREAVLARVLPAVGLSRAAPQDAVTEALAGRSRLSQSAIATIVFGPPPASDTELAALVRDLDELEREVRSQ